MAINLKLMGKYYQGLPHQDEAFDYIQSRLSPETLQKVAAIWRKPAAQKPKVGGDVVLAKVMARLKELGIKLEKPQAGYILYVVGLEGCNTKFQVTQDNPDKWNDAVFILKLMSDGTLSRTKLVTCSTEPGRFYVQNRLNRNGAAFVQMDMLHKDIWMRGKHKSQPRCLIQIGAPITVVRDANSSHGRSQSDPIEKGWFGINFHSTNGNYNKSSIGRWSAGCTVVPVVREFKELMKYCYASSQTKFSYILLDREAID